MQKQRVKNIETKKNYVASRVSKKESNVFLFFEVLLTSTNKENDDERYQTSFVSLLSNVQQVKKSYYCDRTREHEKKLQVYFILFFLSVLFAFFFSLVFLCKSVLYVGLLFCLCYTRVTNIG